MYNMDGKFAIVTGAAKGIGKSVALRLAKEGANIAIFDMAARDGSIPADFQETAEEIKAMGRKVLMVPTDVSKKENVVQSIKTVADTWGRIDILVNVAGVGKLFTLAEVDDVTDWDFTVDIDLKGVFLMCQAIAPIMTAQKSGKIVNFSSIVGITPGENLYAYSAAKAGVLNFTQSLARTLGPSGINVNAVCPGYIWTPMWMVTDRWIWDHTFPDQEYVPKAMYNGVIQTTCLKRDTTTEHVAAAVAWLCSDESSEITGQHINVDGGVEFH
jgi:NAD(P)-dependent dehydrogenase (short-subunit alcohol dehydrogenase family)